ncbi:hypothetical protein [Lysinibacillus endophyticus]|uniref:Uncharacterized protein n=1 Tax=Ureibacillus endophyticus TaxID=1978490 RepID=A0A494Z7H9_9BACL|nr:hypothetical protein [Lysinibacillus endophyticus]MCP1145060.1 hypothetical protein [Lysinibacillus endophyticus]RKQ18484.1 hypothetical protein D8M03_05410 [Lysinibacillus endophyticus]
MDYKKAYETFLKMAFEEIDYPAAPVVYKLSENQKLTIEYIRDLTNQVQNRIMQLKLVNITMKEDEYRKELELFKLNFLKQCLQSPQVAELARYTHNKLKLSKFINKHKKMDDYMDILDNANSHMHTIRIILQELWVSKEVDLVI